MANMQEAYEKVKAPQTGTMTSASSVNPNGGSAGNAWQDAYNAYANGARGQAVAGVYDAQTQAELGGLKAAYDQNLSNQQAAREKIGAAYQQSGNAMQAQYERNRRNLNQQAAANGINTGAGSQQQLALQNVWNRDYGTLQGQQAQAYADADRAIADLQTSYQNAIAQAQAQGDYRKMAALLDDYQQAYNQQLQQAQVLASYGDFSGYSGIYSADQIANMRSAWIASNPQMAYNMGLITAEELARMTGGAAGGSSSRGSYGGYYSGGGSYSGGGDGGTGTTTPPNTSVPAYNQGTVSANGRTIVENARQLGSSPEEIVRAAVEAAERGLIPQSEVNTVIAQANQANVEGNGNRNRAAALIAAGAAWSPSMYQQTGITQAEWARMQQATNNTGTSGSGSSTSNSGSSSTWSNNTSARGAAAHANDEENERRRQEAARSGSNSGRQGNR